MIFANYLCTITILERTMNIIKFLGIFFLPILFLLSCDTTENSDGTVSLRFSTGSSLQKTNDGTLELTEVKILLSDVKLEMEDGEGDNKNTVGEHDGDNEQFNLRIDPFVVNMKLDGTPTNFVLANAPPGSYEEVEFKIHKVEASETPPDPEFKEGDDESLRYSVIAKGTYNSVPFVYKSKKSAHQELNFETPLEILENSQADLTILVDPYSWFYNGDVLLDPSNIENENDIDNNIKESFRDVYEDDDHDGDGD